jgi:F-type H+-transporting ATPase subunit delta
VLDAVHAEVQQLRAAVESNDELRSFLSNPEIESTVKADVLTRIAAGADQEVVNFLRLLAEKGRAGELPEIADELDTLVAIEERILDVELTTATELSDADFGRILGRIEDASGRKVQATRKVDPA